MQLKDNGNQLHGRVQRACGTHVALPCVEAFRQQIVERNAQTVVETNGILVQIVYVNLVVFVVRASQFRHAVFQGILFFVHVGSLTATSSARIFVDVGVLVYHVLGHELVFVCFFDAMFTLQLVLITILTVGNYCPYLALAGQHLYYGILNILDVKNLTLAKILLTTKSVNTVSIMCCNIIDVAFVMNSL